MWTPILMVVPAERHRTRVGLVAFARFMKLEHRLDKTRESFVEFFQAQRIDNLHADFFRTDEAAFTQDFVMKGHGGRGKLFASFAAAHAFAAIKF